MWQLKLDRILLTNNTTSNYFERLRLYHLLRRRRGPRLFSTRLFGPRLFGQRLFAPKLFVAKLFKPGLFGPRIFGPPKLFESIMFGLKLFGTTLFKPLLFRARLFSNNSSGLKWKEYVCQVLQVFDFSDIHKKKQNISTIRKLN